MFTLLTTILGFVLKGFQLASRVMLNRATIIVTFCAGIVAVLQGTLAIFGNFDENMEPVSGVVSWLTNFQLDLTGWVSGNDYIRTIGYGLSIDVLLGGLVDTLFWFIMIVLSAIFTAAIDIFFAVVPLLVDMAISGLKRQFANSLS